MVVLCSTVGRGYSLNKLFSENGRYAMYRLRTNFGSRGESSLSVADYAVFMQNSIHRVQAGLSVDTDSFCEDAHLTGISLLYNTAIFVYSAESKQRHVFNEEGTRGHILLLNSGGHFDMLRGAPGAVPAAAHTHAVSRHSRNWQTMSYLTPQHIQLVKPSLLATLRKPQRATI